MIESLTSQSPEQSWRDRFQIYNQAVQRMVGLAWQAHPILFVVVFLLQLFMGVLPIGIAWAVKSIFDRLATLPTAGQGIVILIIFWSILQLLSQAGQLLDAFIREELQRHLKLTADQMFHLTLKQFHGLAYFESPRFHDLLSWATHGLQSAPAQVFAISATMFQSTITFVSFVIVLLSVNPVLAFIVSIASLPQLFLRLKISRQRFQVMVGNTPTERHAMYLNSLLTNVHNIKEIRLLNLTDYLLNQYMALIKSVQANERQQAQREFLVDSGLVLLSTIAAGIAFFVVVFNVITNTITIGDVTLYISAVASMQAALASIFHSISRLSQDALALAQFEELSALKPDLFIAPNPIPIPPLQTGIHFQDVWFRYSEDHPYILKGINLTIPRGKCVALVGSNGAGKTTLVKLLTRLYDPSKGHILWDTVDICEMDIHQYRMHLSTIFQDFVCYELSAKENIGFGQLDQLNDLDSIKVAARKSNIHDDIMRFPNQYDTSLSRWLSSEISEGINLSGGQWQKIALARLAMRDAELLILDEPTAALDVQSEYEVYQQFIEMTTNQTSLLISHRFSTVRAADYIAVLHNGEIVEYGTHTELLNLNGLYADMYSRQADRYQNTENV